ncbi:cortical protein marker for cell polarity-domain-containing protein [Aspergillus ambiguus]|uniref:putative cellular morphogenesis protein (Rax2) n=1 Tax=Aspergillus ambiguus TaxID=176160 RepID=UPI003CCDA50D
MRISSLFGPATAGLWIGLPLVQGLSFTPVSQPDLDLGPLGQVALTGDFDAATFYAYTEQAHVPSPNNDTQSLLTPLPNGILTTLADADADIRAMCPFTKKDGSFAGIFLGGNFTTLGGVKTSGAALFNPNTTKVSALPGLSGSVSAVLCDQDTNRVYVGGQFQYQNTSNAAAWVADQGWSTLTFGGFNGPVSSILKDDNGHIIFGGAFDGIGNSTTSDKTLQIVNLPDAKISSDAISSKSGFADPRNIICQSSGADGEGKTWLLEDYSPGFWRADMSYEFYPTKLRLYNTHLEGRGTKSFLFRRLPDNGIMNMTYTDPDTGDDVYCDSSCSLSDSTDELYRDFKFVNTVGMSGFMIEVQDWYGAGAGLNGIQLYNNDTVAYAVNSFNEPTCAGIEYPSKSTHTGSWTTTDTDESQSQYLTAQVTDSTAADTSVVFKPDVKRSGKYSLLVYTPGCSQDGSCSSRGVVNVTATVSSDSDPVVTQIYQTNLYEKYDTIYTGHVDASDDSFRPSVTVTPVAGQGDITVVASRVKFNLIHASGGLSGQLNGLYDFDPSSKETNTDLSSSAINSAGLSFDGDASIESLVSHDSVIYVAGNFSSSGIQNIMYLNEDGNATAMSQQGLNGKVTSMTVLDSFLYAGGNFTGTPDGSKNDLTHVAAYSFNDKTWSALGGGVNGPVNRVVALSLNVSVDVNETTIGVSGDFDKLLEFDDHPSTSVNGFAVWVPSQKNWLQNLNLTQMEFSGQLSAMTEAENITILAGNLASGGISAGSSVGLLHEDELSLTPLLSKSDSTGATYTGIYDMSSGRNLTILGGHFTTTTGDGSQVRNLAIIDGSEGTVSGLESGVDSNSTFLTLVVSDDTLYAGGNITGSLGDTEIGGIVVYDLENGTFAETQPPRFTGKTVTVNSIAARPGSKEVYFAGQFDNAGALPCPGICFYDSEEQQWSRPGAALSGNVLAIRWLSNNNMIAVGDLDVAGNKSVVATYTTKGQVWKSFDGASTSDIPGTVTAFTPASTDVSKFWLAGVSDDGSSYLANYNGTGFQFADKVFADGTNIRGLEVLPISKDHENVDLLNDDQILLVTGQLVIPDFGHASAALFNGTVLTPFVLTSTSGGQPGSMSQLFYENKNPYTRAGDHHSNGIVVLVSFCCALGCVFLIVIAGVIFNKIQRRRQGYMPGPQTDRSTNMQRLPPEYLFNSLKQRNPAAPTI